LLVRVALFAHHGSTYLAQPYTVPPAATLQDETFWQAVLVNSFALNVEGCALEVRWREGSADLQFLADGEGALSAHDLQLDDAIAGTALYGDEVDNVAKVHLQVLADEFACLLL
jgi:hypothetical protein